MYSRQSCVCRLIRIYIIQIRIWIRYVPRDVMKETANFSPFSSLPTACAKDESSLRYRVHRLYITYHRRRRSPRTVLRYLRVFRVFVFSEKYLNPSIKRTLWYIRKVQTRFLQLSRLPLFGRVFLPITAVIYEYTEWNVTDSHISKIHYSAITPITVERFVSLGRMNAKAFGRHRAPWSGEQRGFVIEAFWKNTEPVTATHRTFRTRFGLSPNESVPDRNRFWSDSKIYNAKKTSWTF